MYPRTHSGTRVVSGAGRTFGQLELLGGSRDAPWQQWHADHELSRYCTAFELGPDEAKGVSPAAAYATGKPSTLGRRLRPRAWQNAFAPLATEGALPGTGALKADAPWGVPAAPKGRWFSPNKRKRTESADTENCLPSQQSLALFFASLPLLPHQRAQVAFVWLLHHPHTWRYKGDAGVVLCMPHEHAQDIAQYASVLAGPSKNAPLVRVDSDQHLLAVGPLDWVRDTALAHLGPGKPLQQNYRRWLHMSEQWDASDAFDDVPRDTLCAVMRMDFALADELHHAPMPAQ